MDARAIGDALMVLFKQRSQLTASEFKVLRSLVLAGAADKGSAVVDQSINAEPHGVAASARTRALASSALTILDTEYRRQRVRLTAVASRLGVTQWHLAKVLRQTTGESFLAHLHRRRVAWACRLLASEGEQLSVKEIAYEAGYPSSRDLGRHFRRLTGMPPGDYRRLFTAES